MKNQFFSIILNRAFLFAVLLAIQFRLSGQNCISGKVVNAADGKPIPEANIALAGQKGTISGIDGQFRICNLPAGQTTITVSFLGFESITRQVMVQTGDNRLPVFQLKSAIMTIPETVVTATRTDNALLNTPVRVNLISPKLLQNAPLQNVDEVLKYTPGINFSRPFGIFSSKAIVTMRGMSGKEQGRVLVLLDGVPINKSDGGTVDWNMVDLNTVQKIEVTKGAGSAIYGGNAMGGIVNIITKEPADKFQLKASVMCGSFHTRGVKANAGGTLKLKKPGNTWYWLANSFFKMSDGYITQSEADQKASPYIVKSNLKEAGINFKTGFSFNEKHHIEAMVNYYDDNRGTGEKIHQSNGNATDHDSYGIILNYKGMYKNFRLQSSIFNLEEDYKKVNEYVKDDYTWYNVLSTRRDIGWLTTLTAPLGHKQVFTTGFDMKNGSVDAWDKYFTSTDIVYNEGKLGTFALFAQDELSFWNDKLRLIAGLRYDRARFYDGSFRIENPSPETAFMTGYQVPDMETQTWNAVSPRLSAQYKWSNTGRMYAMFSRGFRPSVLDDLCRSGRIKGGFKIANPEVKPEYLNNFETGIDLNPMKNMTLSASVYYSYATDLQYYVTNGQTINMGFGDRPILIRANISEAEIYGAEAEIKVDILPGLQVFANYAYNQSKIKSYSKIAGNDTIDLTGKYFTDVPDHIFTAGGNWLNKIVNSSIFVHYSGSMFINDQNVWDEILLSDKYPAYTTVDLKLWKSFKKHYRLALDIQNLFDTKYYDSKYAVCPGRFVTAEFTYTL